jgi:carbohydrate kinase (thermoresistant glucokinase family)
MGVSGSGKTTIGQKLAEALHCPFYDADDFHPSANKEKMARGEALTDQDREPWLLKLSEEMEKWDRQGPYAVLACSALKQKYRDLLARKVPVRWVYLKGNREVIQKRLEARKGHFFNPALLDSQFSDLEEPLDAIVVNIGKGMDEIVQGIVKELKPRGANKE